MGATLEQLEESGNKPYPNKVFTGLSQIREAQDKRNKRLQELKVPEPQDADVIVINTNRPTKRTSQK